MVEFPVGRAMASRFVPNTFVAKNSKGADGSSTASLRRQELPAMPPDPKMDLFLQETKSGRVRATWSQGGVREFLEDTVRRSRYHPRQYE
jgi:hypothetical protein